MGKKLIIVGADFEENAISQDIPQLDVQMRIGMVEDDNTLAGNYTLRRIIAVRVNSGVSSVSFSVKSGYKISSGIYYGGSNLNLATVTSADLTANIIGRQSPWSWHTGTHIVNNVSGCKYVLVNVSADPERDMPDGSVTINSIINSITLS